FAHWSMSVDFLRNERPLGDAPLDVVFTAPRGWKAVIPVARTTPFAQCPREDPGHTVACAFAWQGTLTLERLTPEVRRSGKRVTIRCAQPCTARVNGRSYRVAAQRRLNVPRGRVVVRIGDARFVR